MNDAIRQWTKRLAEATFPWHEGSASKVATGASSTLDAQFSDVSEAWRASIEKWAEFIGDGKQPVTMNAEMIGKLFSPERWAGFGADASESQLRRVLEGPRYATFWNFDKPLFELQKLAIQRDKAIAAYQAIVMKGWSGAGVRFQESFGNGPVDKATTWRNLVDRWIASLNDALIAVYRTDEFVSAQQAMLRSASDYRLQERVVAEAYCRMNHIPTRTEVDELQREMTEMRRRLRRLAPPVVSAVPAKKVPTKKLKPGSPSDNPVRSSRSSTA